ncbi:hypothetical protein O7627_33065 [Solwaraspora sp. WMMD1047]|uniref:hypothetical protein n=1 Tax=Solwaraspora sp. WMMD1047 TaxID=3016102 RepID=UPI00241628A0|nr:hypothetical protein [Solwaraspora sp. WMMD1047]MDG4834096.1 hypothetical protein [Solwaraspora sp. WMMD1047]
MSTPAVHPDTPPVPAAESVSSLASSAAEILVLHTADEQGMCTHCRAAYALLVPHPCSQRGWASRVDRRVVTRQTLDVLGIAA